MLLFLLLLLCLLSSAGSSNIESDLNNNNNYDDEINRFRRSTGFYDTGKELAITVSSNMNTFVYYRTDTIN